MSADGRQVDAVTQLHERIRAVRAVSLVIAQDLTPEDCCAQSMPDASPIKWHLAHTSWFFETFVLRRFCPAYRPLDPGYEYLFNSYYNAVGPQPIRAERGLQTRPSLEQVYAYRQHVDDALEQFRAQLSGDAQAASLLLLGTHHEQQHQELMLTDLKHLFSRNPLRPAYRAPVTEATAVAGECEWVEGPHGLVEIGSEGGGFCFDNETPRHRYYLQPYAMASQPVTNAEYQQFIEDGGYREARHWLSDGWAWVQGNKVDAPLYWNLADGTQFTLHGQCALDPHAPVCHLSYYEADAYARWAGARLPTEFEWEALAAAQPVSGRFADRDLLHPGGEYADAGPVRRLYGDVWEWVASAYLSYPGFQPAPGAVGEYNGKFMSNQFVLRGGSCATSVDHVRASYRNFFYPDARWQFSGMRLAKSL